MSTLDLWLTRLAQIAPGAFPTGFDLSRSHHQLLYSSILKEDITWNTLAYYCQVPRRYRTTASIGVLPTFVSERRYSEAALRAALRFACAVLERLHRWLALAKGTALVQQAGQPELDNYKMNSIVI